jgi:hypothetical protein
MKGGLPTIQVRDLDIQRDWSDLALATFGRGFYILDDYSSLRAMSEEVLAGTEAILFPTREAHLYIEKKDRGMDRGHGFWTAENPPFGAVFTYWLRDGLKTKEELRIETQDKAREEETDTPVATMAELRAEDLEIGPGVYLIVRDADGNLVRRVKADHGAGLQRVAWDLRLPSAAPTDLSPPDPSPWGGEEEGPLTLPGTYSAHLASKVDGAWTALTDPVEFAVVPLNLSTFAPADMAPIMAFRTEARELRRQVLGAEKLLSEAGNRIKHLRQALHDTPGVDPALMAEVEDLKTRYDAIDLAFNGDRTKGQRNVFTPPSIVDRVQRVMYDQWYTTQAPTNTHKQGLAWAEEAFATELESLKQLVADLDTLESKAEAAGAPWTPGRIPSRP